MSNMKIGDIYTLPQYEHDISLVYLGKDTGSLDAATFAVVKNPISTPLTLNDDMHTYYLRLHSLNLLPVLKDGKTEIKKASLANLTFCIEEVEYYDEENGVFVERPNWTTWTFQNEESWTRVFEKPKTKAYEGGIYPAHLFFSANHEWRSRHHELQEVLDEQG